MAGFRMSGGSMLLVFAIILIVLPGRAAAFGAGNIPSIAQVEGHNWRHGDIEDMLKELVFLHGKKWSSMNVGRVYFGNWLRDYSQAVDVGSLKGVNAATIRILVWVLSFLANGYATEEFEVTEERLGVYRPEEHIDNPLGYADGEDARKYDKRLRGPVDPRELGIDPRTGMKNYIANEDGGWATSAGYLRFSFARSIHYGRVYLHGSGGSSGKEEDLCEGLRCLGQALHTMEDFSAHSNYCELALLELGYRDVFPHCGRDTQINLRGRRVYPLVTGTFGAVDFLHSVIGEATDHFTQSEVDEMNSALQNAQQYSQNVGLGPTTSRGLFGSSSSGGSDFISLVSKLPIGGDGLASQARDLKAASAAQERENTRAANENLVPGMSPNFDPVKVAKQIYPILEFRDRVVRSISNTISKIPGLESLLEKVGETLTAFIFGLLAPFVQPIIKQVSQVLKDGSSNIISSSAKSQLEPWSNSLCDNPTHSMLSKDHFTNVLNSCAGRVAATILKYVVPRILYAWENPGVPVNEVVDDVLRAFHHPAIRDDRCQIQRDMFETVRGWTQDSKHRHEINQLLSSQSVKEGNNHILPAGSTARSLGGCGHGDGGHGKTRGGLWDKVQTRDTSTSPRPGSRPTSSSGGYGRSSRPTSSSGPSGYGHAQDYYSSHQQQQGGYGGPASPPLPSSPGYGYHNTGYNQGYQQPQQQPPYAQPSYAQPPPGPGGYHHGGPPPPPQYGGSGYGQPPPGPGYPPHGGYHPQGPPGQGYHGQQHHGGSGGWGGYGGGYR
ncbi:hypothetical protein OQA88_6252 [Cercophora sp. LCS_1]